MKETTKEKYSRLTDPTKSNIRPYSVFWEDFSHEEILECLRENGFRIMMLDNPSEEFQLKAVKSFGRAIEYIKHPTDKVCYYVINQAPDWIQYIKNPSENAKQFHKMRWEV